MQLFFHAHISRGFTETYYHLIFSLSTLNKDDHRACLNLLQEIVAFRWIVVAQSRQTLMAVEGKKA